MNPLTTAAGIIGIVTTLGGVIDKYTDSDPATKPNWSDVGAQLSLSIGLIFAKDRERKEKGGWRENELPNYKQLMPLPHYDQIERPLPATPGRRRHSSSTMAASWGLYQTPRNTGDSDFYRPRQYGLTDLSSSINQYDWQELIDLSRQLIAQMPDLGAACLQKNMYAVGGAWRPQYLGTNAKWGEAAEEWLQHVWLPQCSLVGGFFDWQRDLLVSAMAWDVDGDDLCIFVIDEDEFPKLAYRPANQVGSGTLSGGTRGDEVKGGPFDGAKICNGIIKDRQGRRLGVRVIGSSAAAQGYGERENYQDIPAHQCDLEAEPVWRVQDRGIPRPAAALMHMLDVQDIQVFLKRGVKLANSIGLVHYNESGQADPGSDVIDERTTDTNAEATDIKLEKRFGGEMYYMRANLGEKLEEVLSKRPSGENMEFLRELKRGGMLALGWFLELVDPERVGGAPMRAIQDEARHSILDRQKTLFRRAKRGSLFALGQAMQTGRVPKNPDPNDWMKWGFGLPSLLTVDAGYDRQADREDLILGVTTKELICQKNGQMAAQVDQKRLAETQRLVANARALLEETNAGKTKPEDMLTLRECIALLQGGSNAPENLRAALDKSQAKENEPAATKKSRSSASQ